ncbi:unnamed protein product, partial [Ilex paraguariensis]
MVLVGMAKTLRVSSSTSKPRASRKEKGKGKATAEGYSDGDDESHEFEVKETKSGVRDDHGWEVCHLRADG